MITFSCHLHRDIKLENLLLTEDLSVKLCDLGSASTKQHYPDQNWSMNQRTLLEDELAKYSTPMYRAPEMLDTWSNYPVNQVRRPGASESNSFVHFSGC